jgi:CelD/BcsL family acetyltransferase involved in cellulose biosynthesis
MEDLRLSPGTGLDWNCLFVLPFWLQAVGRHLGSRGEPHIVSVHEGSQVIGIAPLSIENRTAYFLGDPEVCDYQDLIVVPGRETEVMAAVASHLQARGVQRLELQTLRPEAVVLNALRAMEPQISGKVTLEPEGVTYETALPVCWDDYLMQLNGKQRHEVRRKMRRLESQGAFAYKTAGEDESAQKAADHFLRLFQMNRADKAEFMNGAMAAYFRELIMAAARHRILRLHVLEVADNPAAAVLCFDYGRVRYLYNSAYDAHYHDLSVGIISKVLSVRAGIEAGCRRYDFLKGAETYKKHLGGSQVPLYRCVVTL